MLHRSSPVKTFYDIPEQYFLRFTQGWDRQQLHPILSGYNYCVQADALQCQKEPIRLCFCSSSNSITVFWFSRQTKIEFWNPTDGIFPASTLVLLMNKGTAIDGKRPSVGFHNKTSKILLWCYSTMVKDAKFMLIDRISACLQLRHVDGKFLWKLV